MGRPREERQAPPRDPLMKLHVVIVNYRTAGLVVDCLRTLEPEVARFGPGQCRVVVVDGASGDDSVPRIAAAIEAGGYGSWCSLMPLDHNGGFAYGNNRGIEPALASAHPPQYVHLLNPDTTVYPGALTELVAFMDAHPACGIAGSRCENPDGTARRSAFRFRSAIGEFEAESHAGLVTRLLGAKSTAPDVRDEPHATEWVSGASMIVRREVFDEIGLMDDGYFLYYEEMDFCLRAVRAGFECWYVPASRIVHLCGQSTGATGAARVLKPVPKYWFESRRRYFVKNFGRLYAMAADLAWLGGATLHRVRNALTFRATNDPPRRYLDFVRYNVPEWVK